MKIIYCFSEVINQSTIMKKGILNIGSKGFIIENEGFFCEFSKVINIEKIKINGMGTIIKIETAEKHLFITVPRLFINIGTGFAIINYFATNKLYKNLIKMKS